MKIFHNSKSLQDNAEVPKDCFQLQKQSWKSNKVNCLMCGCECVACVQALEELVNSDFAPDILVLYGSTLCLRYNLARIRLILALCNTIHGTVPPVAGL